MFYFSSRPKGRDFLGASLDLVSDWMMKYVMVKVTNFPAGMGWRQVRGADKHPMTGFLVQDVRKLEEVELFDLRVVTLAMLENERLWKREIESAILGEG